MVMILNCSSLSTALTQTPPASIQSALMSLYSWFSNNGLALNYEKSDVILLGSYEHNESLTSIVSENITGTCVTLFDDLKL